MKKILFLIITLLFSSLATAENEAVYNEAAGSIEIPVLSVKGQAEKFSVTLQQEDTEDLVFTITDATPDPEVESSTNEATYDPKTGVVILPSVMVLEEGKPSVKSYSVELQLTEESIFKISQIEPILALPTNTFNGIPSETLDISVADKASSGSSRCTGNPSQNLTTARENFKTKCGEPWNDQKHVCDYKDADGFHCSGEVSASTTPDPTNPTTSNPPATNPDWCTGTPDRNKDAAKINFALECGQTWNDQLGHVCEWKESNEWHCRGTRSASVPPTTPRNIIAKHWTPRTVFIDWNASLGSEGVRGYDVFRNGEKIATSVATEYHDRNGYGSPRYQIVAIGGDNIRSPSSSPVAPLNSGLNSRDRTEAVGRVVKNGNEERRIQGFLIEREGSVAISARVTDEQGNELGMYTQAYDDQLGEITVAMEPRYGEPKTFVNDNATTVADIDALPDEHITGTYPDRPTPPPTTQPPGDDNCAHCPPPTNPPRDCGSGGGGSDSGGCNNP